MTTRRLLGAATTRVEQLLASALLGSVGVYGGVGPSRPALAMLGVLAALHGIVAFLRSGGERVAPAGLFALTSGVLIALGTEPAWVGEPVGPAFVGAAVAAIAVQIWAMPIDASPVAELVRRNDSPPPAAATIEDYTLGVMALAAFGLALGMSVGYDLQGSPEFLALAAVAMLAVLASRAIGPMWKRVAIPVSGTLVYAGVIHSGDGRLRLVAAGFVIIVLAGMGGTAGWLKRMVVTSIPAGVMLMAWLRLRHIESARPGGSAGRSGLESAVIPLRILRDVLRAQADGWGFAWGSSYLSVPVSFVPSWLPTPDASAIGYDLVAISAPDRVDSGYSLAGLSVAEWVYNFGWFTLPLFALALAWGLQLLDRFLAWSWLADQRRRSSVSTLMLVASVTLVASLPDFVWAGSHTYVMRSLLKLLPVVLLIGVFEAGRRSALRLRKTPTASDVA